MRDLFCFIYIVPITCTPYASMLCTNQQLNNDYDKHNGSLSRFLKCNDEIELKYQKYINSPSNDLAKRGSYKPAVVLWSSADGFYWSWLQTTTEGGNIHKKPSFCNLDSSEALVELTREGDMNGV